MNTITKQLYSIHDYNKEELQRKRILWASHHSQRQEAIKEAKTMGKKGSGYSNHMIDFDTQNTAQSIFH